MTITNEEAIEALHDIAEHLNGDCEVAHSNADDILLALVGPDVRSAYESVVDACNWWAFA